MKSAQKHNLNPSQLVELKCISSSKRERSWKMHENSNASESAMVIEALRRKGWYLEDTDDLKAVIVIQTALADDGSKVLESVESELLNSDLRSIGAKSLPEPTLLRNPSSYIHGPKVLQVKLLSLSSLYIYILKKLNVLI